MQTSSLPAETRTVLNIAYKIGVALGRKFEASDLTPELRQAARLYAATYSGDFEYMAQMRDAVAGNGAFLSDGQSKGVLNCLMADAKRRLADRPAIVQSSPAAAAPQTHLTLIAVPDGRYRVTLADGDHLALRILTGPFGMPSINARVISTRINGDEWMGVAHLTEQNELRLWRSCAGPLRGRVSAAIDVLDDGKVEDAWLVAGLAYAAEGSQCFICGRDLDTPESLTAGYGPVCADKHGLPWGAKAVPMSVRLAQRDVPSEPQAIAPSVYTPKPYVEDPSLTADRARFAAAKAQAKAEGRRMTYEECFPEDANG